jgi:uncharacterized caspase-like protein
MRMRSIAVLSSVIVLCSLFMAAPTAAAAATRGIVVKARATGETVAMYTGSYALIIGVSDYTGGWPPLPGVKSDVRAVKAALEKQGFHVEVVMDPDRDGMDRAFRSFIARHGQRPNNRLLFYYAGHGHTMKLSYGGQMGYLVPREAPNPNIDPTGFLDSALAMQTVDTYARMIQSKHALFVFDACFAGAIFNATRAIPQVIAEKTGRPVREFITSGTADQEVPDQSIFRREFVAALSGAGDIDHDGYVTGAELGQFLESKVTNYSRGAQTPQYGKLRDPLLDQGDFVFVLPHAATHAAVSGPANAGPPASGSADEAVWRSIQSSTNPIDFKTFLATFPHSPLGPFARARLKAIGGTPTASVTPSATPAMHFSYDFKGGPYVRRMSGVVKDPRGLWNALQVLKPPPGAHGGYGLIGDDYLLGKENGYGLRQLGAVARRYLTVQRLYVEQPPGFASIGVQSGTFTNVDDLNDTTLGWVLFDLRDKLEKDLKKVVY